MRDLCSALRWIAEILTSQKVPYQVVGGLAAIAYGSTRELADIDIDVPGRYFEKIIPLVKDHIVFGPGRFRDSHWDIHYMRLQHSGVDIEFADSDNTLIFDCRSRQWVSEKTEYADSIKRTLYGIDVRLIPKERLISYKLKLGRKVDLEDIKHLSTNHNMARTSCSWHLENSE